MSQSYVCIIAEKKEKSRTDFSVNHFNKESTFLTPCGKKKKRIWHKSGKYKDLDYCGSRYCAACRRDKYAPPYSLLLQSENAIFQHTLITVRIGGFLAIEHLKDFNRSVLDAARHKKINYTFCRSTERQRGLINLHIGLFTINKEEITIYTTIIEKFAPQFFPQQASPDQVEITPFDTGINLHSYVSKYDWSNPDDFVIPKWLWACPFEWKRGSIQFFERYVSKFSLPK